MKSKTLLGTTKKSREVNTHKCTMFNYDVRNFHRQFTRVAL